MRFRTESPTRVLDAPSPSKRRAASERADRAQARASRRAQIARLATRAADERKTYAELCLLIEHEMREGRLPLGALPCRNTITELVARYRAGARDAADFFDRPRPGRPVEPLPEPLQRMLEADVDLGLHATAADSHAAIEVEATRLGIPVPTYGRVKAALRRLGVVRRAVGRHGAKAAKLDVVPHSTLPATLTNQVWTLDEAQLPVRARMWCRQSARFVSIQVWLVVVIEYVSRAIVGWHLVDPSRRVDPETGRQMRGGYDAKDVMAALVNAAVRDLAPSSTRTFAGRLCETLRVDLHPTHGGDAVGRRRRYHGLRDSERKPLFDTLRKVMAVPHLPGETPDARGVIEACIKTIKRRLCAGLPGHVDVVLAEDRLPADLPRDLSPEALGRAIAARRTTTNAKGPRRIPRLTLTPCEELPDIAELRLLLDERIKHYNHTRVHPHHGTTPANAYHEALPRRARSGRDLIAALPVHTERVTKDGLVHREDRRAFRFAAEADGWSAATGTAITYRADPLLRCLFAEAVGVMRATAGAGSDGLVLLPPLMQRAQELGARAVAIRQQDYVGQYAQRAREGNDLRRALYAAHEAPEPEAELPGIVGVGTAPQAPNTGGAAGAPAEARPHDAPATGAAATGHPAPGPTSDPTQDATEAWAPEPGGYPAHDADDDDDGDDDDHLALGDFSDLHPTP